MCAYRILGIDPGLARLGYGIVDADVQGVRPIDYGCLETPADWSTNARLKFLYDELCRIIALHQPAVMAVEQLFFYKNVTTAFVVGQARGVALLAGVQANLDYAEYTPMQVKLAVSGYGKAVKSQIQEMVRILLSLKERPEPDDTADALAIAITHARATGLSGSLSREIHPVEQETGGDSTRLQTKQSSDPPISQDAGHYTTRTGRVIRYGRGIKP